MSPLSRWNELAFTRGFDANHLEALAAIASPAEWPAGTVVYREGTFDSQLYLIDEGRIALELTVPGRGPVITLTVASGEVFGWTSFLRRRPKNATARAVVPTKGWALGTEKLRALCDADPAFGYAFTRLILDVVAERLKGARIQLLDVYKT
jgi:CRP-like cAMP-binding protein